MAEETAGVGFRYREDLGAWWPDYDHNPVKCKQFVDHGLPAIDSALKYCRARRVAVQAGGHAGFWPKRLAEKFRQVYTFEPEPILYQCLLRNLDAGAATRFGAIFPRRCGLGAEVGRAAFKSHVSAGSWRVDPAGETSIDLTTVDALGLPCLDALFLDIEGYEVAALAGARATIRRHRPVILVELLPRSKDEIHDWLRGHGYELAERYGRDGIYTPEAA